MDIKIIEDKESDFICPVCKEKIDTMLFKKVSMNAGFLKVMGAGYPIYACSKCKSILPGPSI